MAMIEKIKTLLGVTDNLQDDAIELIIDNVSSHLSLLLGKEIPDELEFIVMEISIRRFNRLGSEGMKSELTEGHRVDFYDLKDEFDPYMDIINDHKDKPDKPKRGRVLFI